MQLELCLYSLKHTKFTNMHMKHYCDSKHFQKLVSISVLAHALCFQTPPETSHTLFQACDFPNTGTPFVSTTTGSDTSSRGCSSVLFVVCMYIYTAWRMVNIHSPRLNREKQTHALLQCTVSFVREISQPINNSNCGPSLQAFSSYHIT